MEENGAGAVVIGKISKRPSEQKTGHLKGESHSAPVGVRPVLRANQRVSSGSTTKGARRVKDMKTNGAMLASVRRTALKRVTKKTANLNGT